MYKIGWLLLASALVGLCFWGVNRAFAAGDVLPSDWVIEISVNSSEYIHPFSDRINFVQQTFTPTTTFVPQAVIVYLQPAYNHDDLFLEISGGVSDCLSKYPIENIPYFEDRAFVFYFLPSGGGRPSYRADSRLCNTLLANHTYTFSLFEGDSFLNIDTYVHTSDRIDLYAGGEAQRCQFGQCGIMFDYLHDYNASPSDLGFKIAHQPHLANKSLFIIDSKWWPWLIWILIGVTIGLLVRKVLHHNTT